MDDIIDTKKLRMFVTIIREGSMKRASEVLFLTPSALSHGIKTLEEDLSTQLFIRRGPVIEPTPIATQIYGEAVDILGRLDGVTKRFSKWGAEEHIQIHIGTTNTGCNYLFPGIVREFRESFPEVALKLEIGDTDSLVNRLQNRQIDMVIAPVQRDYTGLTQVEIGSDELVFIVHPTHPWVEAKKVDISSLPDQRLITASVRSHTYNLIDTFYREIRSPLEPFIEMDNEQAIKQLVSLNIGTGIIPKWIAENEIRNGTLHAFPLGSRLLERRWTISYRSKTPLSFAEFLFVGSTKAIGRNLIGKPVNRTNTLNR